MSGRHNAPTGHAMLVPLTLALAQVEPSNHGSGMVPPGGCAGKVPCWSRGWEPSLPVASSSAALLHRTGEALVVPQVLQWRATVLRISH